jgi:hypothetical protein
MECIATTVSVVISRAHMSRSHLTALGIGGGYSISSESTAEMAALVEALPQLRALDLENCARQEDDEGMLGRGRPHRCSAAVFRAPHEILTNLGTVHNARMQGFFSCRNFGSCNT